MNSKSAAAFHRLLVRLLCLLALTLLPPRAQAQTEEFRAFWVDAFGAGFKSAAEVTTLINDLRSANCNAVVVEVRKRGDAYYNGSLYEPHATDTTPADFDSLQELINQAHDTSGGKQRIEVHAWLVSFKIWSSQYTPPPVSTPPHPYNAHPEWLTRNDTGGLWDGSYTLDPGHPEVQRHTLNVAMDIVSRYDIDGINFDYIRYSENNSANGTNHWGYNPVAVDRFNQRYNRTGPPALNDPLWNQFRRDHITALVRKIYLNTMALKPQVKVSADTITWAPSVTTDTAWTNSARAYIDVLQDWRGWMEEGILDLNIPMNYFRHHNKTPPNNHALDYTNWMHFAMDHKFERHLAIGPGIYLNYISNAITQMRATRGVSPGGNRAEGVCGYCYKQPFGLDKWPTNFNTFRPFLTNAPSTNDPASTPIFAQKVSIPAMPWKVAPTKGHLKGMVTAGNATNWVEWAAISVTGPVSRTLTSDLTGFYGAVDLIPGTYTLVASNLNYLQVTNTATITAGAVTTCDFLLPALTLTTQPQDTNALAGTSITLTVAADSVPRLGYQWYFNTTNALSDKTSAALTLNNLSLAEAGGYSVVLTNSVGAATSRVATVSVYPSAVPLLSSPVLTGGNQFTMGVTGVPGYTYAVQGSTNLQHWTWLATNVSPFVFTNTSPLPYQFYRSVYLPW